MRVRLSAAVLLLMMVSGLSAQEQEGYLAFRAKFRGEPSPSGQFTNLSVSVEGGEPVAIRLYSEPSHTLLGAFLDNAEGEPEDQAWFAGLLPAGSTQVMQTALNPGMKGTLQGPRPKADDLFIHVHTLYRDSNGALTDGMFQLSTRVMNFAFGLERRDPMDAVSGAKRGISTNAPPEGAYKLECGLDGTCSYARINCSTNGGSCCLKTDPQTSCGWCGKMTASCEIIMCPC